MTTPADLFEIAREGLVLVLLLSLPVLGAALLTGVLTAILQAFSKVQEPALTYVPRIVAVTLAVIAAAPWLGGRVVGFAERVWSLMQVVTY